MYVTFACKMPQVVEALETICPSGRPMPQWESAVHWNAALDRLGQLLLEDSFLGVWHLSGGHPRLPPRSLLEVLDRHPGRPLKILPQGLLYQVPFSALRWSRDGVARYLIEDRSVRLAPSLDILRSCERGERGERAQFPPQRALCLVHPSLPHAARELEDAYACFGRSPTEVFRHGEGGAPLSPDDFARVAPDCDHLHLATHARLRMDHPIGSHVDLSPGALPIIDLLRLSLRGTAVLSACESVSSDWRQVFDPISIGAAFLGAGCARVLGALYPIYDCRAADLIGAVYKHVWDDKMTWADALRCAQLAALRKRPASHQAGVPASAQRGLRDGVVVVDAIDASSPRHWASFQFYGKA